MKPSIWLLLNFKKQSINRNGSVPNIQITISTREALIKSILVCYNQKVLLLVIYVYLIALLEHVGYTKKVCHYFMIIIYHPVILDISFFGDLLVPAFISIIILHLHSCTFANSELSLAKEIFESLSIITSGSLSIILRQICVPLKT